MTTSPSVSGHLWEPHTAPNSQDVREELRNLLDLDRAGGRVSVWICAHCAWVKVQDTYGTSYKRGGRLAIAEPPCEEPSGA